MEIFLIKRDIIKDILDKLALGNCPVEDFEYISHVKNLKIMSDEEIDFDPTEPGSTFRFAFADRKLPSKYALVMM